MPKNYDSLERLELNIRRITQELTPENPTSRQLLLDSIISQLTEEGINLTELELEKCAKYISGEISMRELSRYLVKP